MPILSSTSIRGHWHFEFLAVFFYLAFILLPFGMRLVSGHWTQSRILVQILLLLPNIILGILIGMTWFIMGIQS